jgi:hypothetical protein
VHPGLDAVGEPFGEDGRLEHDAVSREQVVEARGPAVAINLR